MREAIDTDIISSSNDLLPPDITYKSHDYQRYVSNSSISNFTPSSELQIQANKDAYNVIDFSESYLLLDFSIKLMQNGVDQQLGSSSTSFRPVEAFLSTLFDSVNISCASTDIPALSSASSGPYQWTDAFLQLLDAKGNFGSSSHLTTRLNSKVEFYEHQQESPDPLLLSLPVGQVHADAHTTYVPGEVIYNYTNDNILTTGTTKNNSNDVYLHSLVCGQRVSFPFITYADDANSKRKFTPRFRCIYKPKHPLFNLEKKIPHVFDILLRLKRSSSLYYKGFPTVDAFSINAGAVLPSTYELVFNNIELYLSKYKPTERILQQINEIRATTPIEYKIRKVVTSTYQVKYSEMNGTFTQAINVGNQPDAFFVAILRTDALTSRTLNIGTDATANTMVNGKTYSFLACSPYGAEATKAVAGAVDHGKFISNYSPLVSPFIQQISIYSSGKQVPSNPYMPDLGITGAFPETMVFSDREYEIFKKEMVSMGYENVLQTVTKTVWNTFLRVFAFNLTDDNKSHYEASTNITNRSSLQLNITWGDKPNILTYEKTTAPTFGGCNQTDPLFTILTIAVSNQSILKLNSDNTISYIH